MHKLSLRALVVPALAAALSASAYTTATIHYTDDRAETVVALTDNTTWKFADGMMNFATPDGNTAFKLGDIASIKLTAGAVGIGSIAAPEGSLSLRQNPVRDLIIIDGDLTAPARFEVFSIAGQRVMAIDAWQGEAVSAAHLPGGLYIIKINNQTFKFLKK